MTQQNDNSFNAFVLGTFFHKYRDEFWTLEILRHASAWLRPVLEQSEGMTCLVTLNEVKSLKDIPEEYVTVIMNHCT
jgi:hypothetical protein